MPPKKTPNQGQKRSAPESKDSEQPAAKKANSDAPKAKKPKVTVPAHPLPTCGSGPVRIDVSFDGDQVASLVKGRFTHGLKLAADDAFKLITTYTAIEGEYSGKQIIVLEPAKPFFFLDLPSLVRKRVYDFYFANKNLTDEPIAFEGKRKANSDLYAKTYAAGSKHRVALLAVNKQIHDEAMPVLYAKPFRLENPPAVLNLLSVLEDHHKQHLRHVRVANWSKSGASAKQAMAFLVAANNLEQLHIGAGVTAESDPAKAARTFWNDAGKLLNAIAHQLDGKIDPVTGEAKCLADAVSILRFGKQALLNKQGTPYTKDEKEIFRSELRKRLQLPPRSWSCVCGSTLPGHVCEEEMQLRREAHETLEEWHHLLEGGEAAALSATPIQEYWDR